jgi:hypothetical protein
MCEAGGPYGLLDRDIHARPSIDSGSFHHPTPLLIGVNDQILFGKKLERAASFHIDGVLKIALNWSSAVFSTRSPIAKY